MDPYAGLHAVRVLEAFTPTPKDERERETVLRSFATLNEIARLYKEATESANACE
ncbi:hypothetical protein SALCHL_003712 [Streptomyces albus subsp. chlorinus]|uniref:hypothetical protein n=1 Tax=Streptomyces albus TaxID=1888 RepID=UPI003D10D1B8